MEISIKQNMLIVSLLTILVAGSTCFAGNIIADSVAEFSGVQGSDNWYYGYYDGDSSHPYTNSSSGDDFELMTIYNPQDTLFYDPDFGSTAYGPLWTIPGYYQTNWNGWHWTVVGQSFMHPTERGPSLLPVRRWVSEVEGSINISGNFSMFDAPNRTFNLDGINGHINVDGVNVWNGHVGSYDLSGINYSLDLDVTAGSLIDFYLSANGLDTCDHGQFTAVIESIPEPATVSILLLGSLFLRRRKTS